MCVSMSPVRHTKMTRLSGVRCPLNGLTVDKSLKLKNNQRSHLPKINVITLY